MTVTRVSLVTVALAMTLTSVGAAQQPCNGSRGTQQIASEGTLCPGTTQVQKITYRLQGQNRCDLPGLGATYSVPSSETLQIDQTGTCMPGSAHQCGYTPAQDVSTTNQDGTLFGFSWNNGVIAGAGCAFQGAWKDKLIPNLGTCSGQFCCSNEAETHCQNNNGVFFDCACHATPLLVVLGGDWRSALGAAEHGPVFPMVPTLDAVRFAWPLRGQRRAGWLVRDRNSNGMIDDGSELYGSATIQVAGPGETKHGFRALALEDGNGDGRITSDDAAYSLIQVWFDVNNDGHAQPGELVPLSDLGITSLDLSYEPIEQTDARGNRFIFAAEGVRQVGSRLSTVAVYDVLPRTALPAFSTNEAGRPGPAGIRGLAALGVLGIAGVLLQRRRRDRSALPEGFSPPCDANP